ncbi:MAG: barstar family protein [Bacilli bacterium]|nr:barstar family protein [Bacilli bacterium]
MEIIIDGNLITNKQELFSNLKLQINSDEFYGNNLDALWDVLSSINEELIVEIKNLITLKLNLGEYTDSLVQLFMDLKEEKSDCIIKII